MINNECICSEFLSEQKTVKYCASFKDPTTVPLFWQCTPLVHQTNPVHPVGCLHQRKSGWPLQSGLNIPNHHHDLKHRINTELA